jgi:hypothetical protein
MKEVSVSCTGPPTAAELTATQKKMADKLIKQLLGEHQGKRIVDLLRVIQYRYPKYVLTVAMERVERKKDDLPLADQVYFGGFKQSLGKAG